jgi:uncharacterized membrane protein YqaE (UPF0057 family)
MIRKHLRKLLFAPLFSLIFSTSFASLGTKTGGDSPLDKNVGIETTAKDALKAFSGLSHKEKKARFKEVKAYLKQYKKERQNADSDTNKILLVILAILLPPLAVYLHENAINTKFWLDLLLTLIFWLPGLIYALIVIL